MWGTCESPIILYYPLKQHYAIFMNSKIKSEKEIGCQTAKLYVWHSAQGINLLSLFDHMIDDVIGQAQTQSTRVALSNQRGSCLVMLKQLVESSR